MPTTRKSPRAAADAPTKPRDEIIALVAAALARLIQSGTAPAILCPDTPANMPAVNLSESAETGLELSGETRLSVPAG